MPAETHIWDGSVYRQADEIYVWDGAAYQQCTEVHVWDGSAWQQVYATEGTVTLTNQTISHTHATAARAKWSANTDGTVDKVEGSTTTQISSSTDWIIPNGAASNDYEFKMSFVSSSGSGYSVGYPVFYGVWYSGGFYVDLQKSGTGTASLTVTMSVRDANTLVVLDTATITLTATNTG